MNDCLFSQAVTCAGHIVTGSDCVDVFFSGKALWELLDELALAGVL